MSRRETGTHEMKIHWWRNGRLAAKLRHLGEALAAMRRTPRTENVMSYKPASYNSVCPYLIVADTAATIRFLENVFGAQELRRYTDPKGGRVMHAEVRIDDTVLMLGDSAPGVWPAVGAHVHIYVPDVDATYAKALDYGATAVQAPVRKGDEDKRGGFNAAGITWWVATWQG
jgi:PhnB protein